MDLDHFIAGRVHPSSGARRIVVRSPATSETIGSAAHGTAEDVAAAVEAADRAARSGVWSELDPLDRAAVLHRVADRLAARIGELALLESAVTGRPVREMKAQIGRLPEWLRHFAGLARGLEGGVLPFKGDYLNYTQYRPYGVVGLLTPWNHPLLIFVKKLSAALAAGNCVVAKPSELAPLSPLLFACLASEAGLPDGVLNVVAGDGAETGAALCAAPQVARLDLTGGTETGRRVAAAAAQRLVPATLELGGKAPVVVFDDTPLDEAVRACAFAGFIASGQTCISGTRFLVQEPLYPDFVEAFTLKVSSIRLGDPADPATEMGPVVSEAQMERVLGHIEIGRREGARVTCGGRRAQLAPPLDRGWYVEPTVFADCTPDMHVVQEEIFGPVVAVLPFRDEADAVRLANRSRFGLGASVWTRDVRRAHRVAGQIRAGIVWVNDHHKNDPSSPWGGLGESGYGKENGWDALRDYMVKQSVVVRLADDFPDWYGAAAGKRYG
jgi:acyl-CoA reductase-like NAD-dependent aldehyde dehydrogenase